jgi:hypothetical protein
MSYKPLALQTISEQEDKYASEEYTYEKMTIMFYQYIENGGLDEEKEKQLMNGISSLQKTIRDSKVLRSKLRILIDNINEMYRNGEDWEVEFLRYHISDINPAIVTHVDNLAYSKYYIILLGKYLDD